MSNGNGIAPVMEEMRLHGELYEEFVLDILTGKYGILKPYWGDEKMQLQNREGFTNIAINCTDGSRPWIWYHCQLEGKQCTIRITYLSQDETENLKKQPLDEIVITDPSFVEQKEESIILQDKTVSAIVGHTKVDERIHIKFAYDQIFVLISMNETVFHSVNWQEFSLR